MNGRDTYNLKVNASGFSVIIFYRHNKTVGSSPPSHTMMYFPSIIPGLPFCFCPTQGFLGEEQRSMLKASALFLGYKG